MDNPGYSHPAVVSMLGGILYLHPDLCTARPPERWLEEQSQKILEWPYQSFRRHRRRLCLLLPCARYQRYPSLACPGHFDLDPVVMKCLAERLRKEAKFFKKRCDAVMLAFPVGGDSNEPVVMPDVRRVASLMHSALALFEDPSPDTSLKPPPPHIPSSGGSELQKVESRCPACILAVVGGRDGILISLRACMLAREKLGMSPSHLLSLVSAWMERRTYSAQLIARSNNLAALFERFWPLFQPALAAGSSVETACAAACLRG
ncbi:hypothetical protein B0T14DRAFT_154041 [Immersiella caudata]|uniref:Uncharacterized protein n=1 Tax=Immersiella caudata TaxID=314043 RepID=A0AA40C3C2_9PEZI|nr:hypothetical protein B0T14DRAFT_154041 [Immersiella caudata]